MQKIVHQKFCERTADWEVCRWPWGGPEVSCGALEACRSRGGRRKASAGVCGCRKGIFFRRAFCFFLLFPEYSWGFKKKKKNEPILRCYHVWPRGRPAEAALRGSWATPGGQGCWARPRVPGPRPPPRAEAAAGRRWVRSRDEGLSVARIPRVAGKGRAGGEGLWHLWSLLSVVGGMAMRRPPAGYTTVHTVFRVVSKRTALASVGFKFVSYMGFSKEACPLLFSWPA